MPGIAWIKLPQCKGMVLGVPSLRTLLYWIPLQLLDVHISVTTSHPLGGEPKYFLQFLDSFRVETCWLFLFLHRMWCSVLINNAFLFSRTLPAFFRGHFELFMSPNVLTFLLGTLSTICWTAFSPSLFSTQIGLKMCLQILKRKKKRLNQIQKGRSVFSNLFLPYVIMKPCSVPVILTS